MIQNKQVSQLTTPAIPCPAVDADSLIGKSFTVKEFVGLFDAADAHTKLLQAVSFMVKSPLAIQFMETNEDNPELTVAMFKFSSEKKVYEPIYIFRLFANLEYIIMVIDEVLGATHRVKGIDLILSKFKNEALLQFLDSIGADTLDKAVTVSLIHLFLNRSSHLINLFDIFDFLPKSHYVIYVNRLCQGNCILAIQKLVKYHKADIYGDDIHFSLSTRLLDLLGNEMIDII
jgi:hypothetical protein